ncbi:conserved hypothetical protein [Ricinus communis]|uniref:Uncharacterized protein n=1 Tax=Ricinus communis TaxID=3988 RepID=B9SJP2_RICCO|nr:conserved hypothetical protein [Ricinus communis]
MDGSKRKEASEGEERALTYIVRLETLACLVGMLVRCTALQTKQYLPKIELDSRDGDIRVQESPRWFLDNLKNRLTLNVETPHFESKEETSFSLAKEVITCVRARLAPGKMKGLPQRKRLVLEGEDGRSIIK